MAEGSTTPGKTRGLIRISDGEGRYAVLAIDQRPALLEAIARTLGKPEADVGRELGDVKGLLAEVFAGRVTGILVDPVYGYARVAPVLPRNTGLLLTLDDHRVETTPDGYKRSRIIPQWGVEAAVRAGADALKLLVYYRPDAPPDVTAAQQAVVAEAGAACRRADRPFVLELLPYALPGEDDAAYAKRLPELTTAMAEAFAPREFAADLYKLPLPGSVRGVREWGGPLYRLADLAGAMGQLTRTLPAPWLLLSGGMPGSRFVEALAAATGAGARGYLAGRAVWWSAMAAYPDLDAMRRHLRRDGVAVLRSLDQVVRSLAPAKPTSDWSLANDGRAIGAPP